MDNNINNNENNPLNIDNNLNSDNFVSSQNTVSNINSIQNADAINNNSNQSIINRTSKINIKKIIIILIIIVIFFICGYLLYLNNNKYVEKNEVGHDKEVFDFSDGIKGIEVNTSLDLAGIFVNDIDLMNSYYSLGSNTKAIIHKNKIYFSYSPGYCPDYFEELKSPYLKNYIPKSKTDLCDKYDKNHNKTYDDLLYRNLMYANLDGTEIKEINRFESQSSILFNYADDNYLFYSAGVDSSVHKIDLLNNKSSLFYSYDTELLSVANYPLSNKTNIVTISQKKLDNNNFTLDYYDYKTLEKKNSISFHNITNTLRLDKYDNTSLYTISNSYGKDYTHIYKNNEIIYTLDGVKNIDEIFTTKNYIYLFYKNQNHELLVKKLDKVSYEEKEFTGDLNIGDYIEYISTGSDDNAYLFTDNGIYYFSEVNDEFHEAIKQQNILSKGIAGDYIYIYVPGNCLTIYNTKTKKRSKFNNVEYYYFDNDKLYIVHVEGTDVRLIYYNI